MFRAQDSGDGVIGLASASLGDFTVAIWFKTTSGDLGYLFGVNTTASEAAGHWIGVAVNYSGSGGDVRAYISQGGSAYTLSFTAPAANDGEWHLLVIARSGSTVKVRFDGRDPGAPTTNALPGDAFVVGTAFGVCGSNRAGTLESPLGMDVAQWGVWNSALSDASLSRLGSGAAFDTIMPNPIEMWKSRENLFEIPNQAASFLAGTFTDEMLGLYAIYSKDSIAPVSGTDPPLRYVTKDLTEKVLTEAELGLQANSVHHVGIGAIGLGGYSDLSLLSFPTDGDAHPILVPSLVSNIRATGLAGGMVRVEWTYDELISIAMASQFTLSFEALSGQVAFGDVIVPANLPARTYSRTVGPLADGGWRVRVYSQYQGNYQAAVTGVLVTADAAPPTIGITGMEAA